MNKSSYVVQKICLSGLFIALIIVFSKVLSIQNIPVVPFVRISLGPSLIIFSSIFLGPVFGGVVGGLSDLLGYFIVDFSGRPPYFLITLMYTLMGILPYFLMRLAKLIKNKKIMGGINISISALLYIFILVFLLTNDQITLYGTTYTFVPWMKAVILVVSFVLFALMNLAIILINRYYKKRSQTKTLAFSPFDLGFVSIVTEFFLPLILGSVLKMHYFEVAFIVIFFSQAVVFFIDIVLNTFVATLLLNVSLRYYKGRL